MAGLTPDSVTPGSTDHLTSYAKAYLNQLFPVAPRAAFMAEMEPLSRLTYT